MIDIAKRLANDVDVDVEDEEAVEETCLPKALSKWNQIRSADTLCLFSRGQGKRNRGQSRRQLFLQRMLLQLNKVHVCVSRSLSLALCDQTRESRIAQFIRKLPKMQPKLFFA